MVGNPWETADFIVPKEGTIIIQQDWVRFAKSCGLPKCFKWIIRNIPGII